MLIDLHTHSFVSDGTESPGDLMRSAAKAGLDIVALTDHDQTSGWDEAAQTALETGLGFVPGIEISCRTDNHISVHLLAYLHDPLNEELLAEINRARQDRITRAQRIVDLLSEDFPITWDLVQKHSHPDATIGRPHIADALVTAGVVDNRSEAFERILVPGSKYYVGHYAADPVVAVELVKRANGVPVFAHPLAAARGRVVKDHVFHDMIDAGLAGLEVFHRDNPPQAQRKLLELAQQENLIVTGSSDYHGAGKPNRLGENSTSRDQLERILELGTGSHSVGIN